MRSSDPGRLSATTRLRLISEALTAYVGARWSLWRHDLPATVNRVRNRPAPEALLQTVPLHDDPQRLVRVAVRIVSGLPMDSRCLMRSLVVLSMLHRRGYEASLVLGVSLESEFAAHAWIEYEGVAVLPVNGFASGRLTTL